MTTPATPATAPAAAPMTYEQFLDSVDEDTHAEFVEGRIVVSSPVSRDHQRIGRFLVKCVSEFVEVRALGEVFYESFQMKTGPDLPGREQRHRPAWRRRAGRAAFPSRGQGSWGRRLSGFGGQGCCRARAVLPL